MEISTVSAWCGVLAFLVLVASLTWKAATWLRRKIKRVSAAVEDGKVVATELLSKATSAARRDDIYTYVQFFNTQIESDRTRRLVQSISVFAFLIAMTFAILAINTFFTTRTHEWMWWALVVMYIVAVVAYLWFLFTSWQLERLQASWQDTTGKAMRSRAYGHLSET